MSKMIAGKQELLSCFCVDWKKKIWVGISSLNYQMRQSQWLFSLDLCPRFRHDTNATTTLDAIVMFQTTPFSQPLSSWSCNWRSILSNIYLIVELFLFRKYHSTNVEIPGLWKRFKNALPNRMGRWKITCFISDFLSFIQALPFHVVQEEEVTV